MRREYEPAAGPRPAVREEPLVEEHLAADWPTQFGRWFAEAVAAQLPEPNAMIVATADADGRPSSRTVLLKGYDERGFVFFTNYASRKGREALANPYASLLFPWFAMGRQVVVCGRIAPVDRHVSEEYFRLRPRGAQLGAWASAQSSVLPDRHVLDDAYAAAEQSFPAEVEVPLPEHWGGLRVEPETVEFWQGRRSRLHDRLRFRRDTNDGADRWIVERLAP
ncbi:pyridoxamine 5'-phosphate oxidase [Catellatospora vulcania]|uniref:pyridoxamine 5'-phosphate oxidase n=1 Tax=Catellatospora vulcania TaxID=1460450 RepID=UPI0012D467A2|nr:pyridoxamine 5'-phosphate oxidase [Catellatospora vulcania]